MFGRDILGVKNGINPVTIAGIQGTYAYNSGNKTFTRLETGEQITVSRPTQF